jgi:DNA topoisomerase-3
MILQQEISRADMQKLLETGKTNLLKGFVSNRTKKKFSAYLVRDPATGKVGFEFEARKPKAGAAPKEAPAKEAAAPVRAAKPVAKKPATKSAAGTKAKTTAKKTAAKKPAAK